jgi:hypothetical protein
LSQRSRAQIRVQVTMSRVGAKTNDLPDESI